MPSSASCLRFDKGPLKAINLFGIIQDKSPFCNFAMLKNLLGLNSARFKC